MYGLWTLHINICCLKITPAGKIIKYKVTGSVNAWHNHRFILIPFYYVRSHNLHIQLHFSTKNIFHLHLSQTFGVIAPQGSETRWSINTLSIGGKTTGVYKKQLHNFWIRTLLYGLISIIVLNMNREKDCWVSYSFFYLPSLQKKTKSIKNNNKSHTTDLMY